MLHLQHSTSLLLHTNSSSSITKHNKRSSIFLSGLRRKVSVSNAMDRDSEFEVDPDKAREALRKLDEQLQSLSNKKVTPPKIRAVDLDRSSTTRSSTREKEVSGLSGSFLTYVSSGLLIFTILYNVIFLTVIKPSVGGPEPIESASMIEAGQDE